MHLFSTRNTSTNDLTSDLIIENGNPVVVSFIGISNIGGNGNTVIVREFTTSTTIFRKRFLTNENIEFKIPFLADKGIEVTLFGGTGSEISVYVHHSSPV